MLDSEMFDERLTVNEQRMLDGLPALRFVWHAPLWLRILRRLRLV